jgi:uncharacterized membrane protein YjfL (UPF0719 family)
MFAPLWQGEIPAGLPQGGLNIGNIVVNMIFAVIWTIVAAVCFAIVFPITIKLFDSLTPNINEMEELKNGNVAVAIVLFGFILGASLVVIAILLK